MTLRVATWNVNSLKARLGRVTEWLEYAAPDVCCMQETKIADTDFPAMAFAGLGYEAAYHGNGRWNGVAIVSRRGIEDVQVGWHDEDPATVSERRLIRARCGPLAVTSVYVPNGREVGSETYVQKLEFLGRLRASWRRPPSRRAARRLRGLQRRPEDRDVWDLGAFKGATHVSEPERKALGELEGWGLVDAFRLCYPDTGRLFSWWDYRAGDFHKGHGMRIDHVLASRAIEGKVCYALIDREARKGQMSKTRDAPSDHAPLFVDLDI